MEKAIYGLMDEETDPKEAAVKKLMEAKKKPNFEPPKKSSRKYPLSQYSCR